MEEQHVRELRDELAIAIARAKSAEARTNDLRDEIESVRTQRTATNETLEVTRSDLDQAREELSVLHARVLGLEAAQRTSDTTEVLAAAEARARDIEREVVEARTRALEAEQRVAELNDQLGGAAGRVDDADAVIASLRVELSETRTVADEAERRISELQARAETVEGRLADVDGVRMELDESVEDLRSASAAAEARVRALEAELASVRHEHEQHSVDLQATHAATAAELTSASARAEHLATEISDANARADELGAELAAAQRLVDTLSSELGDTSSRGESVGVELDGRERPHRPADRRGRATRTHGRTGSGASWRRSPHAPRSSTPPSAARDRGAGRCGGRAPSASMPSWPTRSPVPRPSTRSSRRRSPGPSRSPASSPSVRPSSPRRDVEAATASLAERDARVAGLTDEVAERDGGSRR